MPSYFSNPCIRKEIEEIVEVIKSSNILPVESPLDSKKYISIEIEQETGSIRLQRLYCSSGKFESTFSSDGKGNVIRSDNQYLIENNKLTPPVLSSVSTYNPDGIEMNTDIKVYPPNTDSLSQHTTYKRNVKYPFIAEEETVVGSVLPDHFTGKRYMLINNQDFSRVSIPECLNKNSYSMPKTPIYFDTLEQVEDYYQANKDVIDSALLKEPDLSFNTPVGIGSRLKDGIIKLAIDAGLIEEPSRD